MIELKDGDDRGQGNHHAVTKTVHLADPVWKLERLDAIQKQLLTGLAALGELYRLQDVWAAYSRLVRHEKPDASVRITAAELLAELKPCTLAGTRDDVLEFGNALRFLKGLRSEVEAAMPAPVSAETLTLRVGGHISELRAPDQATFCNRFRAADPAPQPLRIPATA
jgi:hypothetical protein